MRTSLEIDTRSGRSSTVRTPENMERACVAIKNIHRFTVQELEEDLGIPKSIVYKILTILAVPRLLTQLQKGYRIEVAEDNLELTRKNFSKDRND